MSPAEKRDLDDRARLSGMSLQDYFLHRIQDREIVVIPSSRIYKALKTRINDICEELKRLEKASDVNEEYLSVIKLILETICGFNGGD